MLGLLAAWLLFPLLACAVCLGCALLVERAAGARLPGALLLPVGMAAVVAASQLTTYWDFTAEFTVPLVLAVAVAGAVLEWPRLRALRPDGWLLAALGGVFVVFAAPIVLTGGATFAGYTVLGDTANHFLGAVAMLQHGRDFSSLPPSTYEFALEGYFGINAYPAGGPTAVGALTRLVFTDVAWTFQPFLTLLVVFMGAAFWALIEPLVASRRTRAAIVFVAAQPAILLGYALQGSVKEVGTAYAVAVFAALVPTYARQAPEGARRAVPLAVAAAASAAIVGPVAVLWLAPLAAAALAAVLWGHWSERIRPVAAGVALFLAVSLVLSYQAVLTLSTYVEIAGGVVTAQQEVGNLLGPIDPLQSLGVWLVGDYRNEPRGNLWTANQVLLVVVGAAVLAGVVWAARARAWAPAAFVAVSFVVFLFVTRTGSPWADGKATMIIAPAVMLIAGLGAASLPRPARVALLGLLALGVLWSNAYQYHDATPAPPERLHELAEVGKKIDGQGPTLYPEFEEFAKHFLRRGAPEGASEGYQRRYASALDRQGNRVPLGFSSDLDRFTDQYVGYYRTIVLRRGFEGSRPNSLYERTFQGRYYEIWQRPVQPPERLVEHVPLGDLYQPAQPLDCADAERLGRRARETGGRIVLFQRDPLPIFLPSEAKVKPPAWFEDPSEGTSLYLSGPGRIGGEVEVPEAGRYELWAEASTVRPFDVVVDGRKLPRVEWEINGRGTSDRVGAVQLDAGEHTIELLRPGGRPLPGDGGYRRLGPVALMRGDRNGGRLVELPADRWRDACGTSADWAEVIA